MASSSDRAVEAAFASAGSAPPRNCSREPGIPSPAEWGPAAGLVVPGFALVLWEVLSRTGVLPANWLPAPTAIAATIGDLAATGELWGHLGATLARVTAGFLLGAVVATVFGILTGASPGLRALLDPMLQALRNIPSMAWIPLFLLWLGIQEASKVTLIAVGAFFPVYLNLLQGILHINPRLVEVGRVYGYRRLGLVWHVLLPATLPAYLVGLRSGLGLAWMFVVAAEIMGASRGLGYVMVDGQTSSRADLILASLVFFAVLGKVTESLLVLSGRRFQHGSSA